MNYITVENIAKSYGERELFSDISFGINQYQKIALIAKNGTGKTSILNIIAGKDSPDRGQVNYRKGLRLAFLSQEPDLNPELTVEETVFAKGNRILEVIAAYQKALENPEQETQYQKAFEAMERNNAWDFETQYKQILFRLQLQDLKAKVKTLSGGQKKRLALAHALIDKPDILLLDEPTNHLDLEMIEWLEDFFQREQMTFLMVTHDRYFLERVCNEIIELDNNQLYTYKGGYSYYLEKKEAMQEREAVEQHKTKKLFKKELEWMRRQPKARTTKSKARIDDFKEVKKQAHSYRTERDLELELNMDRLGSKIVEFHKVSKSFPSKTILEDFSYTFKKGERVGIIGKNGTGKTTFLNMLTGREQPEQGKIVVGETVNFGYYTQQGITDQEGMKVIDVIREFGDYIPLKKGRQLSAQQLLERFLFDRKKQYDYVEKLSGGERKRLYLCTVLIQNPNFLILDEPTNDLDIVTLNVLEDFLMDFPGCLVVVSHDRFFMDKIVDHLFVFEGEGSVRDFPGTYSDWRAEEAMRSSEAEMQNTSGKTENTWRQKDQNKLNYKEQKEFKTLEKEIASLEDEKAQLSAKFENPDMDGDQMDTLSIRMKAVLEALEDKTERWFELAARQEE